MTTAVESLEALHLWLAEKLPELRRLEGGMHLHPDVQLHGRSGTARNMPCEEAGCPGWLTNVTTDALLEALRAQGWHNVVFTFGSVVICWLDKSPAITHRHSSADTIHEALCRAALKALEI